MVEDIDSFRSIFNRALGLTFRRKKLLLATTSLLLCGILVVFFRGLALHTGTWVTLSLAFTPIFLCAGVLLALGILLVRIYGEEVRGKSVSYLKTLGRSWELLLGACYFSVPIILCYLVLWMALGIFISLREIPVVGDFFGPILAFAPFLINLASLALCVLNAALLFFATPLLALYGLNGLQTVQRLLKHICTDPFTHLTLAMTAMLPLTLCIGFLTLAALLTGSVYAPSGSSLNTVIQWFFVMVPFTALLSPAVVFFFNFSAEAHLLLRRQASSEA